MSTAKAENPMGLKRICTSCGVRFYDMNNRPIICPSCETEFTGEIKVKGRRGRAAVKEEPVPEKEIAVKEAEKEEEDDEEDDGVEVVSLDDEDAKIDDKEDKDDKDDDLDSIPDFDDPIVDDLDTDDDDTLLDEDED